VDPNFSWEREAKRTRIPWDRTIVYETHVKGYTKLHPGVPENERGTYRGLSHPDVVGYIKSLGVTSVELLPVHTFINDSFLLERNLTNYWGYNSIGFFAPDPRYAADTATTLQEFKEMVARFHDAGLEVIIDVVYNHTAEGNELGPTLSFKGIDNASYYRLMPDRKRYYVNDTGTGNTLNLSDPASIQMVCDSLRYWVQEMHVDGFRFDLGHHPRARARRLRHAQRLHEGRDAGPGARRGEADRRAVGLRPRRLPGGRLPAGLGRVERQVPRHGARLLARRSATSTALAPRLVRLAGLLQPPRPPAVGERELHHRARRLHAARHGVVQREAQRRQRRGNRDGPLAQPLVEPRRRGSDDDGEINGLRERQMKNMLATLLLSQGTPMLLAGDEFARTQQGNNNAYCQDNEISWVDWNHDDRAHRLIEFTREVIEMRHQYPILRRVRWLTNRFDEELEVKDLEWINANGSPMKDEQWEDAGQRCFGLLLDGRARETGVRRRGELTTLLLVMNAWHEIVPFKLPDPPGGAGWTLRLDTVRPDLPDEQRYEAGSVYDVTGRSLLLFQLA
jgi:glycogen operon protein